MNDVVVKLIAALLGVSEDTAKKAMEATEAKEAEDLFKAYTDGHDIFTKDEHKTLLKNAGEDYLAKIVASSDEMPNDLYNKVKGVVMQMTEKDIAKKYSFDGSYDSLHDLLGKITEKIKADADTGEGDEGLKTKITELEGQVTTLKQTVTDNDKDWEGKLDDEKKQTNQFVIDEKVSKAIASLGIDVPDEGLEEMQKIVKADFLSKFTVERVEGVVLVKDKDGEVLKDKVQDPRSVSDIVKENLPSFVKIVDSSEGGRGGSSPDIDKNTGLAKIKTFEDFSELVEKKGFRPNSNEASDLLKEVKEANPEFAKT